MKILTGSPGLRGASMRKPGGKKALKPLIKRGFPRNSVETRSMTPGVSILNIIMCGLLVSKNSWKGFTLYNSEGLIKVEKDSRS